MQSLGLDNGYGRRGRIHRQRYGRPVYAQHSRSGTHISEELLPVGLEREAEPVDGIDIVVRDHHKVFDCLPSCRERVSGSGSDRGRASGTRNGTKVDSKSDAWSGSVCGARRDRIVW
jgi:hypothetical protein